MPNMPNPATEALRSLRAELDTFIDDSNKGDLEVNDGDLKQIKDASSIKLSGDETYIICIAVATGRGNSMVKIRCHRGTPLGGYAYDNVNEAYCVECMDNVSLGYIPVSFQVWLGNWCAYIPMPESVLVKHMNPDQKEALKIFKSHFKGKKVTFEYLQLLN